MRSIVFILIASFLFSSDAAWLKHHFEKGRKKKEVRYLSEAQLLFSVSIKLYRTLISSQDSHTCNFTLSCSHFAEKAIKKYGVLLGLLIASDRLQRCVEWSRNYYPRDPISGLAIDYPIEYYSLK